MLKLLKNDLKRTYKVFCIMFGVMAGISLLFPFLIYSESKDSLMLITISMSIIVIVVISLSILFLKYAVQILFESFYKKEGYLTFTLPLTTKQLLLSKIITVTIWYLCLIAVFALCGLIISLDLMIITKGEVTVGAWFENIAEIFNAFSVFEDDSQAIVVISSINSVLAFFSGIMILSFAGAYVNSNMMKKNSPVYVFLVIVVIAIILSVINSIGLRIAYSLDNLLISTILDTCLQIFLIVGGFFATTYLMEYRLELE